MFRSVGYSLSITYLQKLNTNVYLVTLLNAFYCQLFYLGSIYSVLERSSNHEYQECNVMVTLQKYFNGRYFKYLSWCFLLLCCGQERILDQKDLTQSVNPNDILKIKQKIPVHYQFGKEGALMKSQGHIEFFKKILAGGNSKMIILWGLFQILPVEIRIFLVSF